MTINAFDVLPPEGTPPALAEGDAP